METITKINLPTERQKAEMLSPKKLLIYSKPKTGKTDLVAHLDNALIIDLENGSYAFEGMSYNVLKEAEKNGRTPLAELNALIKEIKASGKPYEYGVIDTVTSLENLVMPLALKLYMNTPQGKNFEGNNVLYLPKGAGYQFLRDALFMVLNDLYSCFNKTILLGHIKTGFIEKDGKEVVSAEVDLTGKIKTMISGDVDAIGLLYRSKQNENTLSFKTLDEVTCGGRSKHLKNKEIVISEMNNEGVLKTHWDKIYID